MDSSSTTSIIEMQLVPAPGQKPEFLATLEPTNAAAATTTSATATSSLWTKLTTTTSSSSSSSSPPKRVIVLEGYTRDSWALFDPPAPTAWHRLNVQSIDGRQKLPGFLTYLQQRNKAAYGRFTNYSASSNNSNSKSNKTTGVWVVQPQTQQKQQQGSNNVVMSCWIALDLRQVPSCTLVSPTANHTTNNNSNSNNGKQQQKNNNQIQSASRSAAAAAPSASKNINNSNNKAQPSKGGRGGFLGSLVGAQRRTNEHLTNVPVKKSTNDDDPSNGGAGGANTATRTVSQVLDDFRQEIEQKLLDFDTEEHQNELEIPIRHADHIRGLSTQEEHSKVSMEVLKYLVQEQAEEINEEWIVHQPPSEFLDEITLTIYKEAPPEILEEMNQGVLPDEIRQQQQAIQFERQRVAQQAESKRQAELRDLALRAASAAGNNNNNNNDGDDDDDAALAKLSTVKRDRRTIEDFQRDSKKSKSG